MKLHISSCVAWKSLGMAGLFSLFVSCAPGPPAPLGLGPGLDQIVPLLFLVIGAVLVWRFGPDLLRRLKKTSAAPYNQEPAHSVAQQRYARGEITRDEFLRISEDLKRSD